MEVPRDGRWELRPDVACLELASRHQGVITRAEALERGLGSNGIYRRTQTGLWRPMLPGIFAAGSATSDWHRRLSALTKWSSGVASHRAAARLLRLDGFAADSLEISTERRLKSPWDEAVVHHVDCLPEDSCFVEGIHATSATRTLLDVAAVADPDTVELAVEDALRRGLTSFARLRWCLATHGGRGRRGTSTLRRIVDRYERATKVTESGFETRLHQVLARARLPLPQRQFEIRDENQLLARVDFAYPDDKLAIEAVSYRWHSARSRWARDQSRNNDIAALGWRTVNVTWDELRGDPEAVVRCIRRALGYPSLWE